MNKQYSVRLLLSAGLLLSSGMLSANEQISKSDVNVDDKTIAISALTNMSEYLRSLDKFSVDAQINTDDVLPNGQKIQINKTAIIKSDPPSGLWVKTSSMFGEREFFYNGKLFTVYTPESGYYASFKAPETVAETINKAEQEFNIELPLADLFHWGTDTDSTADIDEALIIGVDKVNGIACNKFAFRQQEIDWQICIQRGETPLPLKLVITSKLEESQPQYMALLKWNTAPDLDKQSYTFTAASTDHKINFLKADNNK